MIPSANSKSSLNSNSESAKKNIKMTVSAKPK